ncbi:MAG: hypothetical protein KA149_12925 [Chitinophagales bacterium]|nr:hypothetical protein [Chitinophagales bacterium]
MNHISTDVKKTYDIVIGEAVSRTDIVDSFTLGANLDPQKSKNVVFDIDTALKGNAFQKSIQINGESNCDITFKIGTRYILFVDKDFKVIGCSYSGAFEQALYTEIIRHLMQNKK